MSIISTFVYYLLGRFVGRGENVGLARVELAMHALDYVVARVTQCTFQRCDAQHVPALRVVVHARGRCAAPRPINDFAVALGCAGGFAGFNYNGLLRYIGISFLRLRQASGLTIRSTRHRFVAASYSQLRAAVRVNSGVSWHFASPSLVEVVDRKDGRVTKSRNTIHDVLAVQHAPLVAIQKDSRRSSATKFISSGSIAALCLL